MNAVPGPTFEDQAVTFIGRYAGLNVFEYGGVYVQGNDQAVDSVYDMIAPDSAILASTTASGAMVYGAISIVEDSGVEIYAAQRVPHSWSDTICVLVLSKHRSTFRLNLKSNCKCCSPNILFSG
jgi:hypothetical protein